MSATTFGRDFVFKFKKNAKENKISMYTRLGLIFSAVISVALAYFIQSVISIWYLIGSICIPGIILLVFGAYYIKFRVSREFALVEITGGVVASLGWFFLKGELAQNSILIEVEPMIAGLLFVSIVHLIGIIKLNASFSLSVKQKEK